MSFQKANVIVVTEHRIGGDYLLLGKPQRGPFQGKLMLPGGKKELNESEHEGACRELLKETGIKTYPRDLEHQGILYSYFEGKPGFEVDIFRACNHRLAGQPDEDEYIVDWRHVPHGLQWNDMLYPDRHWLMAAIARLWIGQVTVWFGASCNIVEKIEINPIFADRLRTP